MLKRLLLYYNIFLLNESSRLTKHSILSPYIQYETRTSERQLRNADDQTQNKKYNTMNFMHAKQK